MDNPAGSVSVMPLLAELEQRVRQAVDEIGRLQQENRRLERELAKARKATAGARSEEAAAWERERSEVRSRVERLARHLEELLAAGAAGGGDGTGQSPAAG